MTEAPEHAALPLPFYDDPWRSSEQRHAQALWHFHLALVDARAPALDGSDLTAYFEAERENVLEGKEVSLVPMEIAASAYEACAVHDLSRDLLGRQVIAARCFKSPIRFPTPAEAKGFIRLWACSHGRLLARLAGIRGSWELRYVDELSTAFFWVGHLVSLKGHVARDWIFMPQSDLHQAGVTREQIVAGRVDEPMRRLLWKQTIRAKDAFAQSEQLVRDIPRRYANAVKRWWLGGLEVLNEIVRRDYDVWSEPVSLSRFYRLQVRFQARFGRTTFRSK